MLTCLSSHVSEWRIQEYNVIVLSSSLGAATIKLQQDAPTHATVSTELLLSMHACPCMSIQVDCGQAIYEHIPRDLFTFFHENSQLPPFK